VADRFEKFTERARRVLVLAQEEARALKHDFLGQEHILLGLVREGEGLAARVLAQSGAEPEAVRSAVLAVVGQGVATVEGELPLTPRAKKGIELAVKEARSLNHDYIGTEHLLLGLLREGEGVGAEVLAGLGITYNEARAEIVRMLLNMPDQKRGIKQFVSQLVERDRGLKRYNLVLPEDLFQQVQELADREHTTVVEVLRRFIKLGLLATRVSDTPGSALVIREGEREREILML
jgi:ATP-dependent Clp protease ATP-binding subunit ClpA